ncbi:MAG TPA: BrnA antitoxin family protein [Gemmatimonadaceae bacterium]|nr:BrnA antitoxin family protein [Gemmatimonadaceae bacterium]
MSADELERLADYTDWEHVRGLTDEEIEQAAAADPDAVPVMSEREWLKDARWVMPPEGGKEAISIRLDRNVLEWFRAQGPRYQSRINAVLRAYVRARERVR